MKSRGQPLNRPVVLLVEDEPLVRTVQVDILREAGFWVLEAQDADEEVDRRVVVDDDERYEFQV